MSERVLFLNYYRPECELFQVGDRIGKTLYDAAAQRQTGYDFHYLGANDPAMAEEAIQILSPDAVIYNAAAWRMPWIEEVRKGFPSLRHIGLAHDLAETPAHLFDYRIVCDPSSPVDAVRLFKSVRPVPRYEFPAPMNKRFCVGSYITPANVLRLPEIVDAVSDAFPGALLRLHAPFLQTYADPGNVPGEMEAFQSLLRPKNDVSIQVSPYFGSEDWIVGWFAQNDFNICFQTESPYRGPDPLIDWIAAAQRPFAVNAALAYRHVHEWMDHYPQTSLFDLWYFGEQPVQFLRRQWSPQRVLRDYEFMLDRIFGRREIETTDSIDLPHPPTVAEAIRKRLEWGERRVNEILPAPLLRRCV